MCNMGGGNYYARIGTDVTNLATSEGYVQKDIQPLVNLSYHYTSHWFENTNNWKADWNTNAVYLEQFSDGGVISRDPKKISDNFYRSSIITFPELKISPLVNVKTSVKIKYGCYVFDYILIVGFTRTGIWATSPTELKRSASSFKYCSEIISNLSVPSSSEGTIIFYTKYNGTYYKYLGTYHDMGSDFLVDANINPTAGYLGTTIWQTPDVNKPGYYNKHISSIAPQESCYVTTDGGFPNKWEYIPFVVFGGIKESSTSNIGGDISINSIEIKQEKI